MALDFEASSGDRVYYALDSAIDYPYTLHARINFDSNSSDNSVAFALGDSGGTLYTYIGRGFILGVGANTFVAFDGGNSSVDSSGVSTGQWYSITGVFAGASSRTVYRDGTASAAETTTAGAYTKDQVAFGISGDSTPFGDFNGKIAECAIWRVALSASEIAALAKGFSPLLIRPDALAFYDPCYRTTSRNRIGGVSLTSYGTPLNFPHPRILPFRQNPTLFVPAAAATFQSAWAQGSNQILQAGLQ